MKRHIHSLQGIPDGKFREARRLRREMTDSERLLWLRLRRN
jgi:very-short-patch-repair endonuclease